jgi:hypothetical protein
MNTLKIKTVPPTQAPHNGRVLVITYVSGKMEWMPYNIEALQHIAACHDLVEGMNIVPMGDTPVQRLAKTAQILVVTDAMYNMVWLPMDVTTLDYVTNNHEMIEDMQIVGGVQ